ncbi:MAG TPA: hypothetical protein VFP86_04970 [bacterium]|nr:hypothetical protein [bacterium]
MRRAVQLVLIFLTSALVTLGIMGVNLGNGPQRPRPASEAPADKINPQTRSANARLLAETGRLREAQDAYLEILQNNSLDPVAMEGLVAVRRQLAADDPAVLRRQAAEYRQAIARRGETPEHYSRNSLEILAAASARAAAVIESKRIVAHPTDTTPMTRGRSEPRPQDRHASRVTKGLQPAAPLPPPAATPHPQPPPTSAPASPAAPATSTDKPAASADKPPAGQPSPAPAVVQETVAVLTPPGEPVVTPSQGSLVGIDCQKRTFVLRGANGDEEYFTTPTVTIYARGASSHRLPDFCGLESYLGHAVTVWTVSAGDRRIAKEVSVTP